MSQRDPRRDGPGPAAAWEPLAGRRDEGSSAHACAAAMPAPQWSPPQVGGMSIREDLDAQLHALAAMEPAAGRRDELVEQAAGGRPPNRPQWSPPQVGGMSS